MSNNSKEGNRSVIGYLILIGGGLFAAWYILKFIFYVLSYVAINFFLALDLSAFGKMSKDQWMGYVLLGLVFGAAGGAIAAQQRFRLNKFISAGAVVIALALSSFVFVSSPESAAFPSIPEVTETIQTAESTEEDNKPKRHFRSAGKITEQKEEAVSEVENQDISIEQTQETDSSLYAEATSETNVGETGTDEIESEVVDEASVLNNMEAYFNALNSDDFSAENYFSTDVKKFINEKNLTLSKINDLHNEYRAEFINGSNRIQKSTIYKMDQIDGLRYYQFWVDFDCYRQSKKKKQTCEVLVEVGFDGQGKIASYQETRVKGLRFFKE